MGSVQKLMPPGGGVKWGGGGNPQWGGDGCTPGWRWNGSEWCWWQPHPEHPIWPPQPPVCPPPPSGCAPPGCFDWIAKAQACWDQSQDLEAFLTQVITDIFTQNPGIIPPPPPSAGTGPIIGVTDGSDAAPGEVGEWMTSQVTGTISQNAGLATYQTLTLTPGDWDCWAQLDTGLETGSTNFFQQLYFRLAYGSTPVAFAWADVGGVFPAGSGFAGGIWNTYAGRVSISAPTLIVATVETFGYTGTPVDITITTNARRMR
jgi:hypothetical protein